MPSNASTNPPPRGDHLMEVEFSYGGTVFHTPSSTNLVGDLDLISRETPQGYRCLGPDSLSLARILDDLYRSKGVPPTPSGPSRGTREMRGFLKEVPWAAGTSNTTEVQASALNEPVATFRATFRPIEIIPSIFTVNRGNGEGAITLTTCDRDPYVLLGTDRAVIFPKVTMVDTLGEYFYQDAAGA